MRRGRERRRADGNIEMRSAKRGESETARKTVRAKAREKVIQRARH
jgi:hypothetical protein